jgi:NifU-like protein involved in Fe-S cluster formation
MDTNCPHCGSVLNVTLTVDEDKLREIANEVFQKNMNAVANSIADQRG